MKHEESIFKDARFRKWAVRLLWLIVLGGLVYYIVPSYFLPRKYSTGMVDVLLATPSLYVQSGSADAIQCERETTIDLRAYDNTIDRKVLDRFTLHNTGTDAVSGLLLLPVIDAIPQDGSVALTAGDVTYTDYYGASKRGIVLRDVRRGWAAGKLRRGSYMAKAFPNWPDFPEEPSVDLYTAQENYTKGFGIRFYPVQFEIPPGESWTLDADYYPLRALSISFCTAKDALLYQSHSLTVLHADQVHIDAQNLVQNWLREPEWTAELDPDYLSHGCYELFVIK